MIPITDDLIARAEAAMRQGKGATIVLPELIAALRAEQVANDDLVRKLKAAKVENEQLRDELRRFGR